eukprot:scaffold2804_cov371-Prasinococcus_capsulatus_cf.AAC.17
MLLHHHTMHIRSAHAAAHAVHASERLAPMHVVEHVLKRIPCAEELLEELERIYKLGVEAGVPSVIAALTVAGNLSLQALQDTASPSETMPFPTHPRPVETYRLAVSVVQWSLLWVREHLVCFRNHFEHTLCVRLVVFVGVPAHGQLPVRLLDLAVSGASLHAQHIVVVDLVGHMCGAKFPLLATGEEASKLRHPALPVPCGPSSAARPRPLGPRPAAVTSAKRPRRGRSRGWATRRRSRRGCSGGEVAPPVPPPARFVGAAPPFAVLGWRTRREKEGPAQRGAARAAANRAKRRTVSRGGSRGAIWDDSRSGISLAFSVPPQPRATPVDPRRAKSLSEQLSVSSWSMSGDPTSRGNDRVIPRHIRECPHWSSRAMMGYLADHPLVSPLMPPAWPPRPARPRQISGREGGRAGASLRRVCIQPL